jgi:hypothetical protein
MDANQEHQWPDHKQTILQHTEDDKSSYVEGRDNAGGVLNERSEDLSYHSNIDIN